MTTDERYYPATAHVNWEPLHRALNRVDCDGWMFMEADSECFYYKHQSTRAYLIVRVDGTIVSDERTGHEDSC